ncbi:MAG: polyamine aminopropyltransferase [Gammaproteobacteria bacterium]
MTERAWVTENVAPGVRVEYEANRVLYHARSAKHEKLLIDNAQFGRLLMLDGTVRATSADEFILHEMMSHVPLLAHGKARQVLIVGGGDCGLADEVLKHPGVVRLTQIETDPQVVKLARSYLRSVNASPFTDPRFSLHIGDGAAFVTSTEDRFDVILVPASDLGPQSLPLFTESFYRDARGCLNAGGVLVAQIGVPFLQPLEFCANMKRLGTVFPEVGCFLVPVPSYFGGPLAFGWGSGALKPEAVSVQELGERRAGLILPTRYYTPDVHKAAFALPHYLVEALDVALAPG